MQISHNLIVDGDITVKGSDKIVSIPSYSDKAFETLHTHVTELLAAIQKGDDMDGLAPILKGRTISVPLKYTSYVIFPELIIGPDTKLTDDVRSATLNTLAAATTRLTDEGAIILLQSLHEGIALRPIRDGVNYSLFDSIWALAMLQHALSSDCAALAHLEYTMDRITLKCAIITKCADFVAWIRASGITDPFDTSLPYMARAVSAVMKAAFNMIEWNADNQSALVRSNLLWHFRLKQETARVHTSQSRVAVYPYFTLAPHHINKLELVIDDNGCTKECVTVVDWQYAVWWPYVKRVIAANLDEVSRRVIEFPKSRFRTSLFRMVCEQIDWLETPSVLLPKARLLELFGSQLDEVLLACEEFDIAYSTD